MTEIKQKNEDLEKAFDLDFTDEELEEVKQWLDKMNALGLGGTLQNLTELLEEAPPAAKETKDFNYLQGYHDCRLVKEELGKKDAEQSKPEDEDWEKAFDQNYDIDHFTLEETEEIREWMVKVGEVDTWGPRWESNLDRLLLKEVLVEM